MFCNGIRQAGGAMAKKIDSNWVPYILGMRVRA
jgi:hypothetical protein